MGKQKQTLKQDLTTMKIFFSSSHAEVLVSLFRPTDGSAMIFFLPPNAATGNRTHVNSVAPPRGTLIQGALPTEQPWLQLDNILDKRQILLKSSL